MDRERYWMKKIFLLIIISLIMIPLNAQEKLSLNTFFNEKDIARVLKGEIITRMYLQNNAVGENTDLSITVPKTRYASEDFSIYEMITDEKAFFPYKMDSGTSKLKFYNILTAYSKLSGMKYFSRKIQKVQDFILECYRIESENKRKSVEDVSYTEIKPEIINYFLQKDNKFGRLSYESKLYNEGDNFVLINTAIDPIQTFVVQIAKKNENKIITYFIYDKEKEGFFYYSVNVMRIRVKFVLSKNEVMTLYPSTFSNRLRAATVHFAKLLGLDWNDKINPWDEDMLQDGKYKNY